MLVQASGMEAWHDFFVAQVGATAALAGLLFVALSINVTQILKYSWLPARGAQTVVVLTGALFEASLALLPAGSSRPVALVSIVIGAITWTTSLSLVIAFVRGLEKQELLLVPRVWSRGYIITAQVATLPAIIGSTFVFSGNLGGYYWITGGTLFTLAFALYNSWILLIEILR
jgi:hypothetical protein